MSKSTFYTNSKIKGYDIVHIDPRYLSYSLFLNYKDCDVDLYGEKPQKLSREKFDKLISSHKKHEVYDLLNYDPDNYERFYKESDWDFYTVDIIKINHVTKEYTLAENVSDMHTDGYDVIGNEIFPQMLVKLFLMLLLKELNYKDLRRWRSSMISCCGDFEAFCTMSSNDESKRDFLFVCNSRNIYFLLVQVDPYFDIELTNGVIFSAIISGLQKIGFTEKRLQIV